MRRIFSRGAWAALSPAARSTAPAIVARLVDFSVRRAALVIMLSALAAVAATAYTAAHFAIDTDTTNLISPESDLRRREARFDTAFPQQDQLILVVVDGASAERAAKGTAALAAALSPRSDVFDAVRRPDGSEFFQRNGLLFLPLEEVRAVTGQLIAAQPFLGALAADPSLRGVLDGLSMALEGVKRGQAELAALDRPLAALATSFEAAAEGRTAFMSWQALMTGRAPLTRETRRFIEVRARLDYDALSPGATAANLIRATAKELKLTPENGVTVRLTGPIPLADEEFATLEDGAVPMALLMIALVVLTLWLAVKSLRIIAAILATLAAGLAITMGLGLWAVHTFSIISIAFVALFVGLGVDFAIQFSVRYRAERHAHRSLDEALVKAGRGVGAPLLLAAATTAIGFFSFLPTQYLGVAQLGLIAGIGMIVALALSVTLLPALLKWVKPAGEKGDIGYRFLVPADIFIARHRRPILWSGLAAGLVCLGLASFVRFDFNPLNLRSHKVESVATLIDLTKEPQTSPYAANVLRPSLAEARNVAARLSKAPEVGGAITLASFVPEDQEEKLASIGDADLLLDLTLNPFAAKPPATDAEVAAAMTRTTEQLRAAAGTDDKPGAAGARSLADTLDGLAQGPAANRERAEAALVPDLRTMLDEVRGLLKARPVTLESLPAELKSDWLTKDGEARIQVYPASDRDDSTTLNAFNRAVLAVAPDASGGAISLQESGEIIMGAFVEAGVLALVVIVLLLAVALGSLRDIGLTLAPLLLAALLTIGSCVVVGLRLNFANVIALPLMLGIGVAFNIYFVMARRQGRQRLLQSSLTRAIIFSAATTASGFGALWLSKHPGTASMGQLLMISLFWTLAASLVYMPALLGEEAKERQGEI